VKLVADSADVDIMIAPVFTALDPVSRVVGDSRVAPGAQNLYWEKEGAYTGEISADMLVSAGCQYVIIGHSERRQFFGETDETVNQKIRAAIDAGLIPVFCVGESEAEREAGQTFSVLDKQVKKGLDNYFAKDLATLVIAYEPVWAIGTGKTATKEQAQEAHAHIRSLIEQSVRQNPVRRQRQTGQYRRPHGYAGYRWWPGRRGKPGSRVFQQNC
jgi:triosephosphate isomerase